MKLVRYAVFESGAPRLGVLTPLGIVDAAPCWELYRLKHKMEATALPEDPLGLLSGGQDVAAELGRAVDWLLGEGSSPTVLFNPTRVHVLAPIARPGKIICVGLNYRDHCREHGHDVPDSPVTFAKFANTILDPGKPIVHPPITERLDYEAELGVVIGSQCRNVPEERALECVGGYLCVNDVTARDLQEKDGQWLRGKSCDTFAPMGPALVTADEIGDPQNLQIECRLNGKTVQNSNTGEMIFTVAYLVAFISEFATLEPGDVISTGTPAGVGNARKPPLYLKAGDRVEVEIEKIGVLSNPVQNG